MHFQSILLAALGSVLSSASVLPADNAGILPASFNITGRGSTNELESRQDAITITWYSDDACQVQVDMCSADGSGTGQCGTTATVSSFLAGRGISEADFVDIYSGGPDSCDADVVPPSGMQYETSDGDDDNPCLTFGGPYAGACALWVCFACEQPGKWCVILSVELLEAQLCVLMLTDIV